MYNSIASSALPLSSSSKACVTRKWARSKSNCCFDFRGSVFCDWTEWKRKYLAFYSSRHVKTSWTCHQNTSSSNQMGKIYFSSGNKILLNFAKTICARTRKQTHVFIPFAGKTASHPQSMELLQDKSPWGSQDLPLIFIDVYTCLLMSSSRFSLPAAVGPFQSSRSHFALSFQRQVHP